jgi:transposase
VADRTTRYASELQERAVRLVAKSRPDHATEWEAMRSVAQKPGIGSTETVRKWVRRAEVDADARPGVSSEESAELHRRRAENRELRRANEILKAAGSSRPSSAGHSGPLELHRRPRRSAHGRRAALGCRAELPGAHRARNADRPQHLLRHPRPHPSPGPAG